MKKEMDYEAQKPVVFSFSSSKEKKEELNINDSNSNHQNEGNSQSWVTSSVHTNNSNSNHSGLSREFQMEFPGLDFDDHHAVNLVLPTSDKRSDEQEILKSSPIQLDSSESSQYLTNIDIDWESFMDDLDELIPSART